MILTRGAQPRPPRPSRPLLDPTVERVALVRLRVGLGDLLVCGPALRALKKARPDAHVVLVTWAETAPIVDRLSPHVDELLAFPGFPGIPDRAPQPALLPDFVREARARRFDLAIQMYGGLRAANEVTSLLGARTTGGFFTPGVLCPDLSTHLPYPINRPEVHRHLLLMDFLGATSGSDRLEFPITSEDRYERDMLCREHGLLPGRYACLHPGATANSRRWPATSFAAVARALAHQGLKVAITGVAGEEARTRSIVSAARAPGVVDLCGKTSLGGLAAVIQSASLFVGNDSGPAHLAASVGTPSVTIFLAGDSKRWAALDRGRHAALQAASPCQPCGLLDCPIDFRCAHDLGVEVVLARALELLDKFGSQPLHSARRAAPVTS